MTLLSLALPGNDYLTTSASLEFPVGSATGDIQCVNITIVDDDVSEDTEEFMVVLSTLDSNVKIGDNLTIKIADNDG